MADPLADSQLQERYARLRSLYWNLRACRPYQTAVKRRWWRRIQAEKLNLLRSGVPHIEVHLWCRFFVDPRNANYKERLNGYYGANVASRFSSGIGWQTSGARQVCQSRVDDQLVRLKAKRSVNNVYYVKHNGQTRDDRVPAKVRGQQLGYLSTQKWDSKLPFRSLYEKH